jgi:hypothetical protein
MVDMITDVAYVHELKRKGADPVIQVLDGRSTSHRLHIQYQCKQQLEWPRHNPIAINGGRAHLSKIIGA